MMNGVHFIFTLQTSSTRYSKIKPSDNFFLQRILKDPEQLVCGVLAFNRSNERLK